MSSLSAGRGVNLLHELTGVLRRALSQQAAVREALYAGILQVLSADPASSELLAELLLPHLRSLMVMDEQTLPPLLLGKCSAVTQVRAGAIALPGSCLGQQLGAHTNHLPLPRKHAGLPSSPHNRPRPCCWSPCPRCWPASTSSRLHPQRPSRVLPAPAAWWAARTGSGLMQTWRTMAQSRAARRRSRHVKRGSPCRAVCAADIFESTPLPRRPCAPQACFASIRTRLGRCGVDHFNLGEAGDLNPQQVRWHSLHRHSSKQRQRVPADCTPPPQA
jgi:hypothetical protein